MKKTILPLFFTLLMLLTLFPANVLAEEFTDEFSGDISSDEEALIIEEELAEIDSQLQVTFDEGYNEIRHSIDSLVQYVKVSCVLTFRDDQHMALRLKTESEVDNSDLRYEGTYQVYNGYVILKYDKYRDSLVISPDAKQLVGILEDDTYQSTLTRTK